MTVAESMVSSTASMIRQQLRDETVFLSGVLGQFEWIQGELSRISRYLKDADAKAREGNDSINEWVVEVMGVAYDADDAVTFFVWMGEQRKRRTFIDKCLFFCCDLLNLHKAGVMIEAVKKNIKEISRSGSNFRLEEISGGESHKASSSRLQQYLSGTDFGELFVGFKEDISALRSNLMRGEPRRCVVSIVGMGGAGKTTLARKLYNDTDVIAHFESNVAWVCVSQIYSIKEVLQGIAEQVIGLKREDSAKLKERELREELREFLKQRKYLLVLDDIWKKEAWDLLDYAFPDGKNGSRILLTTRIEDVALHADRMSRPHKLSLLDKEESWDLFLNIVFPPQEKNGKPICPPQLEGISRQMVAKCRGVPLAIWLLGGLSFTTSNDANEWRKVLDHHPKWQLSHEPEHLDEILELSYLDLPDYLKPCFLYLGIFPEDHEISVEKLTRLWIAEGFIRAREKSSEEDVAEQYVGELAKRSMLQVMYLSSSCRVHDMLRALAIKEAKRVGLFQIDVDPLLFEDASTSNLALTRFRRLGIHHSNNEDSNRVWLVQSSSLPKVHSLLCFAKQGLPPRGLEHAKWLRVLHLKKEASTLVDDNVFRELVHLKYLRIRGVESLPPSINKLYNLQTLDLGWTSVRLPTTIWSLHRLRHLVARGASFDGHPQLELLHHLHTLELVAGEWIEEKSLIKLSELRNLRIFVLSNGDLEKFGEALIKAIQQMVHLQKLRLQGRGRSVLPPFEPFDSNSRLEEIILIDVRILQPLEFPPMLTTLVLIETYLNHDPLPTLGKLTNLRLLTFAFSAYLGSSLNMPNQEFLQLKHLNFIELSNLKEWIVEKGAMPALEHLKVHHCYQLEMLPEGLRYITTLKELIVEMPSTFCQRLEKNWGADWHKIQHVPSVTVFEAVRLMGR